MIVGFDQSFFHAECTVSSHNSDRCEKSNGGTHIFFTMVRLPNWVALPLLFGELAVVLGLWFYLGPGCQDRAPKSAP